MLRISLEDQLAVYLRLKSHFPNLDNGMVDISSFSDPTYNCVGWVLFENNGNPPQKLWPSDCEGYHWPEDLPKIDTVDNFLEFFQRKGYSLCLTKIVEDHLDKIALYSVANRVKHVAKQLKSGVWTSKIGDYETIEHENLEMLEYDPDQEFPQSWGRVSHILSCPKKLPGT